MESLNHLDNIVNDNLADLVQAIKAHNGQTFNPKILVKKFLINVIISMVST